MKNLFKSLMLVAVAAMAFTSCQKENDEINAVKNQYVIEFSAGFDAETRSHFGDKDGDAYPSFWDGSEAVLLEVADAESTWGPSGNADIFMQKVDEDGAVGTFTASYDRTFDGGVITAYVPKASWDNAYNYDIQGYAWTPAIPGTQTPLAGSVEPAAHILKASAAFEGALPEHAQLVFEPATAFAKMTLKLGDVVAFEEIDNVRVEFANQAYTLLPTNLSEPTFWFACEAAAVESMRVIITDKNEDTYVKEFTTEANPLAFKTGVVSTFSVGGFAAKSLDYVTSISANNNIWNGRYEFTIDTIDGARIWLNVYTYAEGGLLPENEDGYEDTNANHSLGYLYADYANWGGYANIKETSIIVEHLDEGYLLDFYFIDDKGGEWEFVYEGVVSGICNPPAPEAAEVAAVAESVNGNGEQYFTLNFTADNYKFSQMWFDTEVAGKIIAEGTFDIGGAVAYLNAEGAETGWEFEVEGTVTVAHDAENKQYNLTFNLEDANGSTFTVTYAGKVEGVYSPGDATPLPNPSNVNYEVVNYTDVKVTWDAVEGAASYELYYEYWTDSKQVSELVTATETTYTFEGLVAGPYYTIYVKAIAADTKVNTDSEYASVYNVQVYNDPASMETKYTFTKAVNTGSNKIEFSNEAGEYCVIKFASSLTSIAPGMYTSSASGDFYVDNWSSGFNGSTQMYPFGFVNVEGEAGAEQTVTIVGADAYYGDQIKAVFTGVIDMEVAPFELTYATISLDGTNLSYYFSGNGVSLNFFYYANGAYGIDEGTYTFYNNTNYDGYNTYIYAPNYDSMTQIDLKVTGKIGEEQTYEFTLYTEYSGTLKANYTGVLSAAPKYGMTNPTRLEVSDSGYKNGSSPSYNFDIYDAEGNVMHVLWYNATAYISGGTNYSYYQPNGGSAVEFKAKNAFDWTDNGDGTITFNNVDMVDASGYMHQFSNVTLKNDLYVDEGGSDEGDTTGGEVYEDWAVSCTTDMSTITFTAANGDTITAAMSTFALSTTISLSDIKYNGTAVDGSGTLVISMGGNSDYIATFEVTANGNTYKGAPHFTA
ncbi:MAG: fibronectin type III domain-containing protein [Alistipes sp.]|nr:fibronectin type III domain-containing protein [Alistipes sp.]